ncbi:putative serine/threonine-protein kinase NAK [Senna tora]|uniref:Putative serine/threonine-protein kinase NAK n=1 Tax=Senna tora TaxID=362788 RepID=A0A835C8U8_9FABA|nr:putative serine/threonine-protein kinase NAK [Senna tora]KAF7833641.1 putative serine/threonine-protein kinase NAK [Senna tora]
MCLCPSRRYSTHSLAARNNIAVGVTRGLDFLIHWMISMQSFHILAWQEMDLLEITHVSELPELKVMLHWSMKLQGLGAFHKGFYDLHAECFSRH